MPRRRLPDNRYLTITYRLHTKQRTLSEYSTRWHHGGCVFRISCILDSRKYEANEYCLQRGRTRETIVLNWEEPADTAQEGFRLPMGRSLVSDSWLEELNRWKLRSTCSYWTPWHRTIFFDVLAEGIQKSFSMVSLFRFIDAVCSFSMNSQCNSNFFQDMVSVSNCWERKPKIWRVDPDTLIPRQNMEGRGKRVRASSCHILQKTHRSPGKARRALSYAAPTSGEHLEASLKELRNHPLLVHTRVKMQV